MTMESLFPSFLNAGISGTVMILAAAFLRLLLKQAPRKLVCLLWLPVLVRLILPFSIPASFSLQPDIPFRPEPGDTVISQSAADVDIPPIALDPGEFPTPQVDPQGTQATPEVVPTVIPSLTAIAASVWLFGAGIMALYGAVSYLRLRWRVRGAIPAEGYMAVYGLDTAFVLGLFRPKIYLPVELEGECRDLVLAHESSHIARGDHLLKMAGFAALTLHWYNPLVWLAFWLMCWDIELACDQRVIENRDAAFRQAYSAALLKLGSRTSPYAHPIAFAAVSVKARIKAVLRYRKCAFWIILVTVAAILGTVVFLMTDPAAPEETIPDTSVTDTIPDDPAGWGLSFWTDNVTTTGCTLHFRQQGGLKWQDDSGAVINGELTMGSMFRMEVFDGTRWVGLEPIAKVQWDGTLYMLPLDNSLTLDISWRDLYGELLPGTYRIVKEITGPGETRPDVVCEYNAIFTITDAHVDDAALLKSCREALEAYQNRGGWHLRQTNYHGDTQTPSSTDTWWISGENFLISTESPQFGASCTMYRDGAYFQKQGGADMPEGSEPDAWQRVDTLYGIMSPWVLLLDWQDENITLLDCQAALGYREIRLRWKGPTNLLANENEYMEVTLGLSADGKLKSMTVQADLLTDGGDTVLYTSVMEDLGGTQEFFRSYINTQTVDDAIALDPGEFPTPELEPNT